MPPARLLRPLFSRKQLDQPAKRGRLHLEHALHDETWLIVGLGNPGRDYAHNRHNVGFGLINRLGRSYGIDLKTRTSLATLGTGVIEGHDAILAKPRTYVNKSGDAVAALVRRYRIPPERVLVVCDDLDLPVGAVRIRSRGGHGGQKGLKSIVQSLGLDSFPRIRIGIGRPVVNGEPSYESDVIADYVLSNPWPEERRLLDEAMETAVAVVAHVLDQGVETAMNRFNRDQGRGEPEV